jgi:uncharacterized membrane protein YccF (DUF307 family)
MRTVLNILNFVLGGFATTLSWLLATLVSMAAACWALVCCWVWYCLTWCRAVNVKIAG